MKTILTSAITLALMAAAHGAALKKASFTRIVNDVKVVPLQAQPKPASVGDVVEGMTTVTTGAQSRAELRFEDKTITRLGANSIFNIQEGTRNIDLKQGVLLLQVPKQMGGARVHTAAVTAAVTGTTVMVAYMPDGYIKCIVLEGEMDMFPNDHPDAFRTLKAGDMIIMKPDGSFIPEPVQVDLAHLKKTSKLLDAKEFGELGNQNQLKDALGTQFSLKQKGDLAPTPLIMPGRDPILQILHDPEQITPPSNDPSAPSQGTNPNPTNPTVVNPKFGRPGLLGGTVVLDDETVIVTDPQITAAFSGTVATGQGRIFRPGVDGAGLGEAAFDVSTRRVPGEDGDIPHLDHLLKTGGSLAAFRFSNAYLIGSPQVVTAGGPVNLLLASDADFTMSSSSPVLDGGASVADGVGSSGSWDLNNSGLKTLVIAARDNIYIESGFTFSGSNQTLVLYTHTNTPSMEVGSVGSVSGAGYCGGGGDIDIAAFGSAPAVSLPDGAFEAHAARDLHLRGGSISASERSVKVIEDPSTTVAEAKDMHLTGGRDVIIESGVKLQAGTSMTVTAQRDLKIYDSAVLKRLTNTDSTLIRLVAQTGNVELLGGPSTQQKVKIDGYYAEIRAPEGDITLSNVDISAGYISAQTLATDGTITIGNSSLGSSLLNGGLLKLYAEGSNGKVLFNGNTNLYGPATIAAKTVEISDGVVVNVATKNGFNVHSDIERFNSSGYGNFSNGNVPLEFVPSNTTGPHKGDFSSRPPF